MVPRPPPRVGLVTAPYLLVIDMKLVCFPDCEGSVAFSLSEDIDRPGP